MEEAEHPSAANGAESNDNSVQEVLNDNPFAYLHRNEFTSEKFKIEIRNLPRHYGLKELKKLLNKKLQLKPTKIKVVFKNSPWSYVTFRSEEDKLDAIKVLNKYKWKNRILRVEEAKPVPDPLVSQRILQSKSEKSLSPKNASPEENIEEKIRNSSTSFWKLSYTDQLQKKVHQISNVLKKMGRTLVQNNPALRGWWSGQAEKFNGLPCDLFPVRHTDTLKGYRNKCEFSTGINEATGERTVGFRLGSYAQGSVTVGPVDPALNVPDKMKSAAKVFEKFVRDSELDVYNPENHEGYWQQFTARYGFATDQLMLIIGINPQKLQPSELEDLKNKLRHYFTEGEGNTVGCTSLYLQQMRKKLRQQDEDIYEHLLGDAHITERVLGRTFRISPRAFFQVNTGGAEVLYEAIRDLAGLTQDVTLLDVCCGTGAIGISLSDKCGEVLGLEMSPEAIADAEANASTNNVTNAKFFVGKAEDILSAVAYKATKEDIVAVVDPPRSGLQQEALIQLRKTERIRRLVYVSCNPQAAVKNFVDLGRGTSKMYKGEPFLPLRAILVDLFPLTPHCELVVYFERSSNVLT